MTMNTLLKGLAPMHPGELLREDILPAVKKPKAELARMLGISRQTFYDILNEKQPVTPEVAIRIGKLFGNGPGLWLNLQQKYDLWKAEKKLGKEIRKIPTLKSAA